MSRTPRILDREQNVRIGFSSLEEYSKESSYKLFFSAGSFLTDNVYDLLAESTVVRLKASTNTLLAVTFPRPSLWIKGTLELTTYYGGNTTPGGGDETIDLTREIYTFKIGDNLTTGGTQLFTDTDTITLSSKGLATQVDETTNKLESNIVLMTIRIARAGTTDNYTGRLYIAGVLLEYRPSSIQ